MITTISITGPVSRKAGGLFQSVRHLYQSLQAPDLRVHVLGVSDEFSREDIPAWAPVEVSGFQPFLSGQFGYSRKFYKEAERFHPDIIHTHGLWVYSSIVTTRLHRKFGTPYLISPHGMLDPWAVANSRWKKRMAHLLFEGSHLRQAACIRALCESEARSIRAYGLKNPVAVIPNGINLPDDRVETSKVTPAPWHDLAKPGCKILFFLSRIHPKKGLENLLRAWAENQKSKIKNRNSEDWVLAIAGWDQGGHENELKRMASELGISWTDVRDQKSELGSQRSEIQQISRVSESRVQELSFSLLFLGPQFDEEKAGCYRECDAFILPSFSEGLPMVILEAWAYGKPVMMTPGCNLPVGFESGAAQCIEADPASIARGLADFFNLSESDRGEMGRRGLELVKRNFTWESIAVQMRSVYDWILGGGNPPDCVRFLK